MSQLSILSQLEGQLPPHLARPELAELVVLMRHAEQGAWAFAVYNKVRVRDEVAEVLRHLLNPLAVFTYTLSAENPIPLAHLQALPPAERAIVFFFDLQQTAGQVWSYLELQREHLADLPFGLIFWITPRERGEGLRQAPNFWSQRSAVFDFTVTSPQARAEIQGAWAGQPVRLDSPADWERQMRLFSGLLAEYEAENAPPAALADLHGKEKTMTQPNPANSSTTPTIWPLSPFCSRLAPLALLLTLILLAVSPPVLLAQDKTLYWERYDTDIEVQSNGDMLVEETQDIVFTNGTFRFGYAAIPLDRVEDISEVSVAEIIDGVERPYQANSSAEYGFTTAEVDDNLEITWYFPATSNSRHVFVLRYRVQGGLRIYDEGDQVWWKAIPPDHNFPINQARVTVAPPQTFPRNQLVIDSYGAPVDNVSSTDRGGVVFSASNIPAGEELEVRVQFPHGVVEASPPAWQATDDAIQAWGPVVGLLFGALGLALLFGGPVGVYMLWYSRGRDEQNIVVPELISEPPSGLPAAIVGTLVDEHAETKDIIASLLDLAQRGAIRMEEEAKKNVIGITNRDFIFHLEDASLAMYPYETRLLERIFGKNMKQKERRLKDLHNKFYTAISEIEGMLYSEVVKHGYFPKDPKSTRSGWTALSVIGIIGSFGLSFCLLMFLGVLSPAVACPALSLGLTSFALLLVSRHMPRKTAAGAEEAAKWLAFKRYLEEIGQHSDLEAVKDRFEAYLPYAMAFGLEKRLIKKFSAVDTPAPRWWGPVIIGYPHHGYGGYGLPADSAPGGPPGPLAGDMAGGAPSLSGMSEGLGNSLSNMSAGLGSLLNSASSTLTSRPAPQSSSGGGGGFSGGGSFGGGGGGGGSRGFG